MTKRIFLAINLPQKTREKINNRLLSLIPRKGMKPVNKKNLHITMAFLGYLNEKAINDLVESLDFATETKGFEIKLNGIGRFKNRIIWLGVKNGSNKLKELNGEIVKALEIKNKRFHSHVTLARNKTLKPKTVDELLKKLKEKEFTEEIAAKSLDVMESVLSQKGPTYHTLKKIKFK